MTIEMNATLRAVAQFTIANVSRAQNVYHFAHVSLESKTDEQVVLAIAEYVEDLYDTLVSRMSTAFDLEKIECFVLNWPLWEPIGVAAPTWQGGNVNDRSPSGVAMLVNAYKERSGYADKKFLAGWTEEDLTGDQFGGAAATAAAIYAAAWITQYTGSEATLLLPVAFTALTGQTRPYTSTSVDTKVSYQRRRKPGVGLT